MDIHYKPETIKELKEIYPNNIEFHLALDNNSPDAWDFVSGEMKVASDEMRVAADRFKTLGNLFQSLSESGFPGA